MVGIPTMVMTHGLSDYLPEKKKPSQERLTSQTAQGTAPTTCRSRKLGPATQCGRHHGTTAVYTFKADKR